MSEDVLCYNMVPCSGCSYCNDPLNNITTYCEAEPRHAAHRILNAEAMWVKGQELVDKLEDLIVLGHVTEESVTKAIDKIWSA